MEEKNEFNQLSFLTSQDFTFGNAPLYFENIPDELKKSEDIKKIVNYNNRNKGIITNDFLIWALETGISYDVISWFIRERLRYFDETQNRNLVMFMKLRKISSRKNKYFDNMSKNLQQIERIQFLMEYCNL